LPADMACSYPVPIFLKSPVCRQVSSAPPLQGWENRSAVAELRALDNAAIELRVEVRAQLRSSLSWQIGRGVSFFHSVFLCKSVPGIADSKGSILLSGNFDPISCSIVDRRRVSGRPRLRRSHWLNRHNSRLLVDNVSDEHSGHCVLLAAQLREVQLPEVFKTRRTVDGLHHHRLSAFANSVVHDGNARPNGMNENFRVRRGLAVMQA